MCGGYIEKNKTQQIVFEATQCMALKWAQKDVEKLQSESVLAKIFHSPSSIFFTENVSCVTFGVINDSFQYLLQ